MDIKATVKHQFLQISPCVMLAEDSRNYMRMVFDFQTDDWDGTEKTAQFKNPKTGEVYESILDSTGACEIRWEATADSGTMSVSVFGINGDYRITTGIASVYLMPTLSGGESDTPPSPDVYQQLLTMLGQKADNMTYSDSVLRLLSGSKELASVIIAGGGSSVQPDWNQNDSGAADYIKNRPFYDDTNVLLEWDGNTEGLVAATTTEEVNGIPAGTAVAYKIAEYMDPESFIGATEIASDGSPLVITEEEIGQFEGITYVGLLYLTDKAIVADAVRFPEAGVYSPLVDGVYVSKVYTGGIVKLPNKYLNLDTALNEDSENPVQNKAVVAATATVPLMVRLSMGQGISFSESYDTITQALRSGRPVIGIVDWGSGDDLVLPYWDEKNNIVYFDVSKANMSWKYGSIGKSGGGYNVTEYAADLPALTPDGREANAGRVVTVSANGISYELKKFNATDVGALSGTTASSWADVPELLANYDTVLYNTAYGNPPEGLRAPALIVADAIERGGRNLTILDGSGQIWTGSVNLSAETITVQKVDAGGIKKLDNGSNIFSPWEQEDGIYEITNESNTFLVNGITGDESEPTVSLSSAITLDNNVFYASISTGSYTPTGITKMVTFTLIDSVNAYQWVYTLKNGAWSTARSNVRDVIGQETLTKDNTIEYTPTGDYNPATKKYVDDAVGGVSAATPRQQMQNTDTTVTLQPGILYVFPEMATLAVTLATPTNTNIVNEYHFFFDSGATPTTFSLAAADGSTIYSDAYSIDANMRYEVSVLDNVAYIKGVSMSEA